MKYTVPLLFLLIVLCIGWAHAAPPEGSCIMDLETCKNYDGGTIYLISDLPYSEDLMVGWHDYDASNPSYRALPAPYSDYSGYVLGVTPGDNSLIITKPGYQPLTLSYHICDCKYTFVSFTLKKTPPVIKPGSANFPAAIFTTLPKLDKPTLVAKVTTTAAAQGSGSKIGVSGSQNFGAAAGALSGSTQDGSSSGNQQTGSGSGSQQPGTTATGGTDTANTGAPSETGRVRRSLHAGLDHRGRDDEIQYRACGGKEVAGLCVCAGARRTGCGHVPAERPGRVIFFNGLPLSRRAPASSSGTCHPCICHAPYGAVCGGFLIIPDSLFHGSGRIFCRRQTSRPGVIHTCRIKTQR